MSTQMSRRAPNTATGTFTISPQRLRQFLERLGPVFIKVGQFLALRPDLISQEYCNELLELTDNVSTFPFDVAEKIIAQDLGGDPSKFFSWIDHQPLAAGSLAQVHRARTLDDDAVIIKILRPNIHEAVKRDLRRAKVLVRFLKLTKATVVVSPEAVLTEISSWMEDELDLQLELRNLTRMYDLTEETEILRVPKPYPELSGAHIVTAEYLPGVPLVELLKLIRGGHIEKVAQLGFDRAVLARNLLYTVLEQIFRFQFFHADTHPGNVLAMEDNSVGFVDFGLADTLDPTFRRSMIRLLSAVYANDFESMFHGLIEVLEPAEGSDLTQFRTDFFEQSRKWQRERDSDIKGVPRRESPVSRYLVGVLRAARQNGFIVPSAILSMYRALLTAETVASQLGGEVDLAAVGRQIFEKLQIESLLEMVRLDNWQPIIVEWMSLVREGPRQTRQVIGDLLEGRLVLKVNTLDSKDDRRLKNLRARLISASIVSVGLATLLGTAQNIAIVGRFHLSHLLWSMLIIIWLSLILTWRRLY